MSKFGMGQSVRRKEDQRFLTGQGRYTDDINMAGQAIGFVVRAPIAHGRIERLDVAAARAAPGVLAVITHDDLEGWGVKPLPVGLPVEDMSSAFRPLLAPGKVSHAGEGVAFVVAETLAQAKDAAELVEADYEELDAVPETGSAMDEGRAQIHGDAPRNRAFAWSHGDREEVDRAFEAAAHVVRLDLVNNRLVANPMEPRAMVCSFEKGELTAHGCSQGVWMYKDIFAGAILGIEPEKVHVFTSDVGGGFGTKAFFHPEYGLAALASRELGRPVKWTAERTEGFLSDVAGRDHVTTAELALDADHVIQAMRCHATANMGAYLSFAAPFIPTSAALKVLPGVYDVKKLRYEVEAVFTTTVPVDAYRGAGRPESNYCMERLMDKAAIDLGVDRIELRRKNFIAAEAMPFKTSAGELYDSGHFETVMTRSMANADWAGFGARREEAAGRGRYLGIGMCYYIESTMGDPNEGAAVSFEDNGRVSVAVGTQSGGQGHATAYAQVLHDKIGVPFELIDLIEGDSDRIRIGGGTGGSRSLTAEGTAIRAAGEEVIKKGRLFAALEFETAIEDIAFHDGSFEVVGTDRKIAIMELAAKARERADKPEAADNGLDSQATISMDNWTFPNGCHIAEVEIDPETGAVAVERYTVVDDFGFVVNPMLVEGQVHGGLVQGIGQALLEHAVHDEAGQLVTGSLMDYAIPRADNLPFFSFSTYGGAPCANNEMGVKGCGEAGSVGSCAAVINAVIDALRPLGVNAVDMPATPQRVWRLIETRRRVA